MEVTPQRAFASSGYGSWAHTLSRPKNDTKNLVRAWSWNERAIQNKIARASSRLQKKNARSQFWNAQSNFWHAGSAVELPLRRDLTKADRSISCGSCNVFCAC